MKITLQATVGVWQIYAEATELETATAVVEWVYRLENREERAAIQQEPAPVAVAVAESAEIEVAAQTPADPTVDDAIDAVKAFAGRRGTVAAREMMLTLGIKRTAEITSELVPAVMSAARLS